MLIAIFPIYIPDNEKPRFKKMIKWLVRNMGYKSSSELFRDLIINLSQARGYYRDISKLNSLDMTHKEFSDAINGIIKEWKFNQTEEISK